LYQNLLKDKFNEKNWNNVKFLGKVLFWLAVVVTILLHSPNSYRGVKLKGATGEYILCEASDPMSKPVHAKAVLAGD
ncbi:MAG: hypothetical protein LBL75_03975, partial [Rickettsiales bacterium]|jgi:hypothetical protein|nr:hypothetical protein [Rickettsiales bacterium]